MRLTNGLAKTVVGKKAWVKIDHKHSLQSSTREMVPFLTRRVRKDSSVDEETENSLSCQSNEVPEMVFSRKQKISQNWREKLALLTRVGARGNTRPPLGQMCLVMVGKNKDLGQIGLVTSGTPAMVAITSLRTNGTDIVTRLKRPSSLILLEAGLTLEQEANGSIWIRSGKGKTHFSDSTESTGR